MNISLKNIFPLIFKCLRMILLLRGKNLERTYKDPIKAELGKNDKYKISIIAEKLDENSN